MSGSVPVLPKSEFDALCKRVQVSAGKGAYEELTEYIDSHWKEMDPTRNVQWAVRVELNGEWFASRQLGESWKEYIRDLVTSVVRHSAEVAKAAKRKAISREDMSRTLRFLDEVS